MTDNISIESCGQPEMYCYRAHREKQGRPGVGRSLACLSVCLSIDSERERERDVVARD